MLKAKSLEFLPKEEAHILTRIRKTYRQVNTFPPSEIDSKDLRNNS